MVALPLKIVIFKFSREPASLASLTDNKVPEYRFIPIRNKVLQQQKNPEFPEASLFVYLQRLRAVVLCFPETFERANKIGSLF